MFFLNFAAQVVGKEIALFSENEGPPKNQKGPITKKMIPPTPRKKTLTHVQSNGAGDQGRTSQHTNTPCH